MNGAWAEWDGVVVASAIALPFVVLLVVGLAVWRRGGRAGPAWVWWRSAAEVGVVAGTLPWLWMILTPKAARRSVDLVPLRELTAMLDGLPGDITTTIVQLGGNLLVFAALGFFAPVRFTVLASLPRLVALGAAGSVVVEALQFVLDLGRVSAVDDVLLNACGALLAGLASRPWWGRGDLPDPVPWARTDPGREATP